jgi:hypothetical protein
MPIECGLVVSCIGYQTPPIEGVPYEHGRGRFANAEGVIGDGLYCVGWARRGPTGTIGTNRPDGFEVAEKIFAAFPGEGGAKAGGPGLDTCSTPAESSPSPSATGSSSRPPRPAAPARAAPARSSPRSQR